MMWQQHLIHPFQETVPNFQVAQLESRRQQAQKSASLKLKAKWKPPTITNVIGSNAQSNGTELQQTFAPETYNHVPEKKEPVIKIEESIVDLANAYNKKYTEALAEHTKNEEKKDFKEGRRSALSIGQSTATGPVLQDIVPKADIVPEANVQRTPQKATSRPQSITISVDKSLPAVKLPAASDESTRANDKLAKFRYPMAPKTDEPVSDNIEHQDSIAVVEEELSGLQVEEFVAKQNIRLSPSNQRRDQDMDTTMDDVLPTAADVQQQSHHSEIEPTATINDIGGKELNNHLEGDSNAQNSATNYNKNVPANIEDQEMIAGQKRPVIDEKNEEPVGRFDVL
jgi:hypothetical protein